MPRIIDCHVHHLDDTDVPWARELGYEKVCLMDHRVDVLREALRKYPDFVIAVGYLPLQDRMEVVLDAIERYREIGCLGLKACGANARYDDERHYPAYAKAQEYGLPVLFHTGWLDLRIATRTFPLPNRSQADWYHPVTLDRITLDFPGLKLVALHMGGTWQAMAGLLMQQYPNIYADSCTRFEPYDVFWDRIGGEVTGMQTLAKMVYGTDGMASRQVCRDRIAAFSELLDAFDAPAALQDRIFYRNPLYIFGLDEALRKKVRVGRIDPSTMDLDRASRGAGPAGAAKLTDFTDLSPDRFGAPTRFATTCWLGFDDRALHLLFSCKDENAGALELTPEGPVANLWQDDSVEVFLSPQADDIYWHFIVSASGRAAVQKGRGEIEEYPHAAECRVTRHGWTAKLTVPFALVGEKPSPGAAWGLQICRNKRSDPAETLTWTEVATTFHDPSSFGRLVFD